MLSISLSLFMNFVNSTHYSYSYTNKIIQVCAHVPGVVIDSRSFVQIIRGMNSQMHTMAVCFHDMNKELKHQRSINIENHAMLLRLTGGHTNSKDVQTVTQEMIVPDFHKTMVPKLKCSDISLVVFEYINNPTVLSYERASEKSKGGLPHLMKRVKKVVDIVCKLTQLPQNLLSNQGVQYPRSEVIKKIRNAFEDITKFLVENNLRKTASKKRISLAFLSETKVSRAFTTWLDDRVVNEEIESVSDKIEVNNVVNEELESISDKSDEGGECDDDIAMESDV